ncbi:MAG: arginine decarboxylase, pyruvoyl-dependent [candidate division Zixibacteria bacterium]|nr:arginine decarboxylase, pyruvoyl-dependent [candidate division Zixibacteria bacterium]
MVIIPKKIFLTKGVGVDKEKLSSFELALRSAGIAGVNLVHVSSIFPPHCKLISKKSGLSELHPGQIVFSVMSRNETNESNRLVSASVGLAIPNDRSQYGYLSEHSAFGQTERISGDYAEDLAAGMLASTLGIDFDVDKSYDEKKEIYKISGKIVRTTNITQSSRGHKNSRWTTVVAAAIFLCE